MTVVGAGAVGLAVALELAREGFEVEVLGASPAAPSASAVAAGMVAPASEAVLDGATPEAAAALMRARDRWEAWSARLDVPLSAHGALHVGPDPVLAKREATARALGLACRRRADGLWFPQDALLAPEPTLARLAAAAREAGAALSPHVVEARDGRLHRDGVALDGSVVLATGWGSAALASAAAELAVLQPIKGQLLRLDGPSPEGPVVRAPGAYLAPGRAGWTVGATMEAGRSDLVADPAASAALQAAAAAVRPELARREARSAVGVRAAAPDGAPLVGRSRSGVWLATGMRRNGWLLAPMVAEALCHALTGGDVDAALAGCARAWDPRRFAAAPPQPFPSGGERL